MGEASAIALAMETSNAILIIDDLKGRKLASKMALSFMGTLGFLIKAKEYGIIKAVKPYRKNSRYRFQNFTRLGKFNT